MARVKIDVSPEGEVEVEVNDVQGASCEDLTSNLEAALGEVSSRGLKPEHGGVRSSSHAQAKASH